MDVHVTLGDLRIEARYRPAIPGSRRGHVDNWTEGEPEEIAIISIDGDRDPDDALSDQDIEAAIRDEALRRREDAIDAWLSRQEASR